MNSLHSKSRFIALAGLAALIGSFVAFNARADASPTPTTASQGRFGQLPLMFERNSGQTDPRFHFVSRGAGHSIYLAPTETVIALEEPGRPRIDARNGARGAADLVAATGPRLLRLSLVSANPDALSHGEDRLPGHVNHVTGPKENWTTNVAAFARVQFDRVYPGVDLVFYGNQRQFEYDFLVAPGASPDAIAFRVEGADRIEIDRQGDLVLHAGIGSFRQHRPVVHQTVEGRRQAVDARFVVGASNVVTFALGSYDRSAALVIDPVLSLDYSTYLGGSKSDRAWAVAADAAGHVYVAGDTFGPLKNVPAVGMQTNFGGGSKYGGDAFVAKLDVTGSNFVYFTYLGGDSLEVANGLAVDGEGSAYVTGFTISALVYSITNEVHTLICTNFSLTNYLCSPRETVKRTVTTGTTLVTNQVTTNVVRQVNNKTSPPTTNDVYTIVTTTLLGAKPVSEPFPTFRALQENVSGTLLPDYEVPNSDVFVTKLDATGAPVYSTFLGGEGAEVAAAIAVDINGYAYVTGYTESALTFRVTNEVRTLTCTNYSFTNVVCGPEVVKTNIAVVHRIVPYQVVTNDMGAVVAKTNPKTTNGVLSVVTTTLLGSEKLTEGFPIVNAVQTNNAGRADIFVAKLSPDGASLVFATYLGGALSQDYGTGIGVDAAGFINIVGYASEGDFPTTNALQAVFARGLDGVVARLDPIGSSLVYSTYLGGSLIDVAYGLATSPDGSAYVVGSTSSHDFLTTPGQIRPGGVFRSLDGATNWAQSSVGLTHTGVRALAINPVSPTTIYAGTPRGVFLTTDAGSAWALSSESLARADITAISIDPITPSTVYAAGLSGFVRSEDSGFTWNVLGIGLPQTTVGSLAFDSLNPDTLHAGTSLGYYVSTNRGTNFLQTGSGLKGRNVYQLAVHPSDPTWIYAGTDGGVFQTTNGGANWRAVNTGLDNRRALALAINPSMPDTLIAGTAKGIYRTMNAGAAWTSQTNGLGRPQVNAVLYDPTDSTVVYAACTNGIFRSADGGATWAVATNGLLARDFVTLAIDPSNPANIYAGARGTNFSGGTNDAFLVKLSPNGLVLEYGFTFGGSKTDEARAVAVDTNGSAFVTGLTLSKNFPVVGATPGIRWQGTNSGKTDAFIAQFDATGTSNVFSIHLGGKRTDSGFAIALDGLGGIYVVGSTDSGDFVTTNAFQSGRMGDKEDAFVTKLTVEPPAPAPAPANRARPRP